MSLSNFHDARRILFLGARAVVESSSNNNKKNTTNGRNEGKNGLAHLLQTWAICEWHLGNLNRAEVLFDNAWRLVKSGDDDEDGEYSSMYRVNLLYSIARLKKHMGKFYYAQHCVALAMKENNNVAELWALWAEIASETGNEKLETSCLAQYSALVEVESSKQHYYSSEVDSYSRLLSARSSMEVSSAVKPDVEKLLSRDPWQVKLFSNNNSGGSDPTTRTLKQLKLPIDESQNHFKSKVR